MFQKIHSLYSYKQKKYSQGAIRDEDSDHYSQGAIKDEDSNQSARNLIALTR